MSNIDIHKFDINSLTFKETILVEEISGLPVTELMAEGKPMGRSALAIAFVVLRRANPDITIEEVENMPIATFDGMEAAPVPPPEGDESKPSG